jgi:hypothetical protein
VPYKLSVLQYDAESPEQFIGYDPVIEDLAVFLNGLLSEILNTYIAKDVAIYGAKALEVCTLSSTEDNKHTRFVIEYLPK